VTLNDYFLNFKVLQKNIKISLAPDFDKGTTLFQEKQSSFEKSLSLKNS